MAITGRRRKPPEEHPDATPQPGDACETPADDGHPDTNGVAADTATEAMAPANGHAANGQSNGQPATPKNAPPVYKVGPIPTRKGESIQGCVWEHEFVTPDGRVYKTHSVEVRSSYFSERDGTWHDSKGFKPSQLSALEFVLRRCGDFCFSQRDPQQRLAEGEVPT